MTVSITDIHNRLSHWLKKIPEKPIIITRRNEPVGVLISHEEYQRLRQVQAYLEMLQLSRSLQQSEASADALLRASREELEARQ